MAAASAFKPEGTFTAIVTPMRDDADRTLDLDALERLVEQQIAGTIDGLVACGTTGETVTLSDEEWATVVKSTIRFARGRVPVIAGTGTNSTHKTIALSQKAEAMGADALLIVTPYYNKPSQQGLLAHYKAVAAAVNLPIILYNVPGRTGCNLLPATVAELAHVPNIVAVKEAAGSLEQVLDLCRLVRPGFGVLSGEDALAVPLYAVGGHGVISVMSNPVPALTAALYRDFRAGRIDAAAKGQQALHPLVKTLFSEPNPQPAKMAMHLLGLMEPVVRMPLITASDATREALERDLRVLGVLPA